MILIILLLETKIFSNEKFNLLRNRTKPCVREWYALRIQMKHVFGRIHYDEKRKPRKDFLLTSYYMTQEMVLHWNFFILAHASGAIFSFFLYFIMCFYAKCLACHILLTAEVFSFSEEIRGFVHFSMKSYLCEIFKLKDEKNF